MSEKVIEYAGKTGAAAGGAFYLSRGRYSDWLPIRHSRWGIRGIETG